MSTIRANAILDASGGNTATINGITPIDATGVLSTFNAAGSAPVYACRAWVNFNGTGTVAIRASGNVSSITDNGTGDYTINFATAMPDANYAVNIAASRIGLNDAAIASCWVSSSDTRSASSKRFRVMGGTSTFYDPEDVYVSIFR